METRERIAELTTRLRDAAKLQDPLAQATIQLIRLSIDELKESLVEVEGNDMLRKQGAARQFSRLLRELTTEPPSITKPGAIE